MAYRTIKETFWTDPKIQAMTCNTKLLYLYLITASHSHYSGIFYLPTTFICLETGLPEKTVKASLGELESNLLIRCDNVTQTLWVVNMYRHQRCSGGNPEALERGLLKHFDTLHSSGLICEFIVKYPNVSVTLKERYRNVLGTFSVPVTDTVPVQGESEGVIPDSPKSGFVLPEWIPSETWEEFKKVRKKKKAACTDYAHGLIIKELGRLKAEFGNDPVEVLNKSIKSGWADVYPLKPNENNGGINGQRNGTGYANSGKEAGGTGAGEGKYAHLGEVLDLDG